MKLKPIVTALTLLGFANTSLATEIELPTRVTISGLVQVEAQFHQDYEGTDSSDFVIDEVDFVIEAQVHQSAKATIAFLYEEDGTDLEIDEAFITLGNAPLNLTVGQIYVPFGNFESHMISDPLTLEVAETREKAAQVNFEAMGLNGSVYVFNGATQEDAKDQINHYGANIGFARESESLSYDVGFSYISDLGDSDGWTDTLDELATLGLTNYDYVEALGIHFNLSMGGLSFYSEYITALDKFNVPGLSYYPAALDPSSPLRFNAEGAKPEVWNVELGYSLNLAGKDTTFAIGYQGTQAALALGLPEARYLLAGSMEIYNNTTMSVEYAYDEDYAGGDDGTGHGGSNLTFQIALEF